MRKTITQTFSVFTSLALVGTSIPVSAMPAAAPEAGFVRTLTPPEHLGYVASSYDAGGSKMPRLIVMADLHGHIDVQKNLMGMLDNFVTKLTAGNKETSQQRVPIFVEGGWEKHLEEPLRVVTDSKTRSKLADYYLNKAELSAAQAYSEQHVGAGNFTLTGVEDPAEYEANRLRFAETYPVRKTLLEAIAQKEQTLNDLSGVIENRSFKKLQALRKGYEKGTVSQDKYAKALIRQSNRYGIHNRYVDILKRPDSVPTGEFDVALTEVYRLVAPEISRSRPLLSYIRKNLEREGDVRQSLAAVDADLDLLKRTLGDQLTPDEVPYVIARLARLSQLAKALLADQKFGFDITTEIEKSLDFYPLAFLRDETLVKNALSELSQDSTNAQTGILIAGGFHSQAITEYLKQNKVPFMLVNPQVERNITAEEQLNYIKRVCEEHVTPEEIKRDMAQQRVLAQSPLATAPMTNLMAPVRAVLGGNPAEVQAAAAVMETMDTTAEAVKAAGVAAQADTQEVITFTKTAPEATLEPRVARMMDFEIAQDRKLALVLNAPTMGTATRSVGVFIHSLITEHEKKILMEAPIINFKNDLSDIRLDEAAQQKIGKDFSILTVSPDSQHIFVRSTKNSHSEGYELTRNADGSFGRPESVLLHYVKEATYSSDGKKLALIYQQEEMWEIAVINRSSRGTMDGRADVLTSSSQDNAYQLMFSPKGTDLRVKAPGEMTLVYLMTETPKALEDPRTPVQVIGQALDDVQMSADVDMRTHHAISFGPDSPGSGPHASALERLALDIQDELNIQGRLRERKLNKIHFVVAENVVTRYATEAKGRSPVWQEHHDTGMLVLNQESLEPVVIIPRERYDRLQETSVRAEVEHELRHILSQAGRHHNLVLAEQLISLVLQEAGYSASRLPGSDVRISIELIKRAISPLQEHLPQEFVQALNDAEALGSILWDQFLFNYINRIIAPPNFERDEIQRLAVDLVNLGLSPNIHDARKSVQQFFGSFSNRMSMANMSPDDQKNRLIATMQWLQRRTQRIAEAA